jgi:hypothetical protein
METKSVTLPSGANAKIKKPGFLTLAEAQAAGDNTKAMLKLVARCTVAPKLTLEWQGKGDVTSIEDIDPVDVVALAREIQEFGGLDDLEARIAPLSKTENSA